MELSNKIYAKTLFIHNISSFLIGGFGCFMDKNSVNFSEISAKNIDTEEFGAFIYVFFNNSIIMQDSLLENLRVLTYNGGVFYMKDSNILILSNISLIKVQCQEFGGFAYLSVFNSINCSNLKISDVFARIGNLIYSENNNRICFVNTSIFNEENQMTSSLIYTGIQSNLMFFMINSTIN